MCVGKAPLTFDRWLTPMRVQIRPVRWHPATETARAELSTVFPLIGQREGPGRRGGACLPTTHPRLCGPSKTCRACPSDRRDCSHGTCHAGGVLPIPAPIRTGVGQVHRAAGRGPGRWGDWRAANTADPRVCEPAGPHDPGMTAGPPQVGDGGAHPTRRIRWREGFSRAVTRSVDEKPRQRTQTRPELTGTDHGPAPA